MPNLSAASLRNRANQVAAAGMQTIAPVSMPQLNNGAINRLLCMKGSDFAFWHTKPHTETEIYEERSIHRRPRLR